MNAAWLGLLAALTALAAAPVTIDGDMAEWAGAAGWTVPEAARRQANSPRGAVERVAVRHDDQFLYCLVVFTQPRPFRDATQDGFADGFWSNTRYLQLDTDLDGRVDYYTNQIKGRRPGLNNTYVVHYVPAGDQPKAATYLWYEGSPTARQAPPLGQFAPDGRSLELRVPYSRGTTEDGATVPVPGDRVGVQVLMSYRDQTGTAAKWVGERYPAEHAWLLYSLTDGTLTLREPSDNRGLRLRLPRLSDVTAAEAKLVETGPFQLNRDGQPSRATRARLGWDANRMRVVVTCEEADPAAVAATVTARDGPVHRDDCVELFLDVNHDRRSFHHLAVNLNGAVADAWRIGNQFGRDAWDAEVAVKTSRGETGWTVDLMIPFESAFGVRPRPGEVWGINFGRERHAAPAEYSTWAPLLGSFLQPERFGEVLFVEADGREPGFEVVSRGWLSLDGNGERNALAVVCASDRPTEVSVTATRLEPGKPEVTSRAKAALVPGERRELTVRYDVTDEDTQRFRFELATGGKVQYRNEYPAQKTRFPRVFAVPDALFGELLSDRPMGLARDGVIYWSLGRDLNGMRPFALQYGQRYVYDEMLDLFAQHRLMILDNAYTLTVPVYHQDVEHRRRGTRGLLYPPTKEFPDPAGIDKYLTATRECVAANRDILWGIYAGDEAHEHARRLVAKRWAAKAPDDAWIRELDATVRRDYGHGKYGLPTPDDSDPFRWLALNRWLNATMQQVAEKLKAWRDAEAPGLKLISWDPVAALQGLDFGRWGETFDVITHQLYPSRDPNRCEFGFITKVLVDLTAREAGGPEVWPCAHVEHYAGAFTPEEVNEYLSQVFRNGGLGLHLYLADTVGRSAGKGCTWFDFYGSPPRWRALMQTVDRLRTMNRPALPAASKAAILLATDTMNAAPDEGRRPDEAEALYDFLGPWARRWFQFIDDNQLERGDRRLADYSVVLVPLLSITRKVVVERLEAFVRAGGQLVVFDPEALTWYDDGTSAEADRLRLLGVKPGAAIQPAKLVTRRGELPLYGAGRRVAADAAEVTFRFDTGEPALIHHPLGQGAVDWFATNPLQFKALGDPAWRDFFAAIADDLKLPRTDLWRFKLPPFDRARAEQEPGVCLTGNYLLWDNNSPLDVGNARLAGSYRYSLAPDAWRDEGGEGDLPFDRGDLTDRRQAPSAGDCFVADKELRAKAPPVTAWAVSWKQTAPFDLTFDLLEPRELDRVRFFYSGQLPPVNCYGSSDGQQWARLAGVAGQPSTADVPDVVLPVAGRHRYLRLSFGPRGADQRLTLAEVEIWGKR